MRFVKFRQTCAVILLGLYVLAPQTVFASAGLSDAGRTSYYKLNEKHALNVLPLGDIVLEDGQQLAKHSLIGIVSYTNNPDAKFYNTWDVGEYVITDTVVYPLLQDTNMTQNTYIQNGYIWNDEIIYEIDTGKLIEKELHVSTGENNLFEGDISNLNMVVDKESGNVSVDGYESPFIDNTEEFDKKLADVGLNVEEADVFNLDYIQRNSTQFERLDVAPAPSFGSFMVMLIGIPVCLFVVVVIIVVIVTVKVVNKKHG